MATLRAIAGRKRTTRLLATTLLAFTALGSCACRDSAEVRSTVERLIRALHAGNRETVAALAPGISDDAKLEQVFLAMAKYPSWSITEVIRLRSSARARVNLYADTGETTLQIPLLCVEDNWLVHSRISMSTHFDFVPRRK